MKELLDLFQRNRRQLEKQVFLCCFISIFIKTVEIEFAMVNLNLKRGILNLLC